MGFLKSLEVCFVNYFTFSGRASKREYWWFALFNFIVVGLGGPESVLFLAFIFPGFAAGSRRLHDTGKSGWWQLLWVIPIVGWIILILFLTADPEKGANKYGPPLNDDGEVDISDSQMVESNTET